VEHATSPEPFKKAHRAYLTSSLPLDASMSRHALEPAVHLIQASEPGSSYVCTVAIEFDAAAVAPDQALEWLLTKSYGVTRFERAGAD
jgi:hypothetical protein